MSQQELLNRSYRHVVAQGRPSVDPDMGSCLYNAENGDKCAAGIFITEYDPRMEGNSWGTLCYTFPDNLEPEAVEHQELVGCLQTAHDQAKYNFLINKRDFVESYKEEIKAQIEFYNKEYGANPE